MINKFVAGDNGAILISPIDQSTSISTDRKFINKKNKAIERLSSNNTIIMFDMQGRQIPNDKLLKIKNQNSFCQSGLRMGVYGIIEKTTTGNKIRKIVVHR